MASRDFIEEFLVVVTNAVIFIGSGEIVMNIRESFYCFYIAVEPCKVKGLSQFAELVLLNMFARMASITNVFKPIGTSANRIE